MLLQCGFALPFLWSQVLNPIPGRSHSRAIYAGADKGVEQHSGRERRT